MRKNASFTSIMIMLTACEDNKEQGNGSESQKEQITKTSQKRSSCHDYTHEADEFMQKKPAE